MSSTSYSPREVVSRDAAVSKRSSGTWLWSLTGVCFLFGAFLAMQMNAQNRVQSLREKNAAQPLVVQAAMQNLQGKLKKETASRTALQNKLNALQNKMAAATGSSLAERKQLAAQMRDLQMLAGLSKVSGPGIVITVSDNPDAAKAGEDTAFLPGIVHDYDLLQIVNELRNSKAEAIAINGVRVTGYTPIRCVGAPIYIDYQVVAAPFRIEAIGDASILKSSVSMPGGIVEKLSAILPVRVKSVDSLTLPAVETTPRIRHAKAN
ncbi:MAG TPA: DUF881 domain-containing protein [Abditibacteriaceae bacterium]|jgi:uncharacterized protein YlxW (UPF0749 family)